MRRMLAMTMMMLMTTAALAGCAGSDLTDEDVDAAREEGRLAGIAEATPVSTPVSYTHLTLPTSDLV